MSGGKHNKGCCTPLECTLLSDSFDRADSSTIGPGWVTVDGSPAIVSSELSMTAGDKVATTAGNASHRGVTTLSFRTTGSGPWSVEITLNYGTINECVATLSFSDTSCTLTTGTQTRTIDDVNVGQRDNLLWRRSDNDEYFLEVALTNHLFWINFGASATATDGSYVAVWDSDFTLPTSGAGRMAIEVIAGSIAISGVLWSRHNDDLAGCPDAACECTPPGTLAPDRRFIPWRTRMDFFSDDGSGLGCDIFNDGYLIFENAIEGGTGLAGDNIWDCVSGSMAGEAYGYGSANPAISWRCGTPNTIDSFPFSPVDCSGEIQSGTIDSCDPLVVTYDTHVFDDITSPCNPCVDSLGTYYAVMTDAT